MRTLGNHGRLALIWTGIESRMWSIPFLVWAIAFALMLAVMTFGFRRL
jgi:hypothetical protein